MTVEVSAAIVVNRIRGTKEDDSNIIDQDTATDVGVGVAGTDGKGGGIRRRHHHRSNSCIEFEGISGGDTTTLDARIVEVKGDDAVTTCQEERQQEQQQQQQQQRNPSGNWNGSIQELAASSKVLDGSMIGNMLLPTSFGWFSSKSSSSSSKNTQQETNQQQHDISSSPVVDGTTAKKEYHDKNQQFLQQIQYFNELSKKIEDPYYCSSSSRFPFLPPPSYNR